MLSRQWLSLILLATASMASAVHLPAYLYHSGRDSPLKIRPKPCISPSGQKGQCMFVWDCIKGEGKHLGRCVDRFLFGTCCGHDVGENSLSDEAHLFHVYGADPSTGLSFVTVRLNLSETANTTTVAPDSSEIHTNTPQSTIVFHDGGLRAPEIPTDVTALSVTVQSSVESSTVNSQSQTPVVTGGVQDYYAAVVPHSQQQEIPDVKTKSSTTRTTTTLKTTTMATTLPASSQPGITAIQSTPAAHVDMTTTLSTQKVSPTAVVVTTTRPTTTVVSTLATTSTLFTTSQVMGIEGTPSPTPARVPSKVFRDCGLHSLLPQMRIVGGKSSRVGSWPWQVSVRRSVFFGFSSTHRCGGAVLNENWVATAGHCVADLLLPQIRIRIGEYDLSTASESDPFVERSVLKRHVHPKYNADTYDYDLALVRLDKPLESAPNIQPICLPNSDELLTGKVATITGWGRLKEGGILPSVLQEVQVPIVSNSKCEEMFLSAGRRESIPDFFICAGYETGGRDSCQGDSGGPLQIKGNDGHWFLAGIISWGIGCGEPNLPGVCTRISKFKEWILDTIEKDGG